VSSVFVYVFARTDLFLIDKLVSLKHQAEAHQPPPTEKRMHWQKASHFVSFFGKFVKSSKTLVLRNRELLLPYVTENKNLILRFQEWG